jgi:hypothetical protein
MVASVTGQQDDGPAEDDVLEQGRDRWSAPSWRPGWWPSRGLSHGLSWWPPRISRPAAVVSVAALILGLGVGYLAGARTSGRNPGPAASAHGRSSAQPVSAGGPTLEQSGNQCSAQHGTTLQLGVEISNLSGKPLTLGQVRVVLPLGGMRVTAVNWGSCGERPSHTQDPPQNNATDRYLPPGASGWLTATAEVLVPCPKPYPVQFAVGYVQDGQYRRVLLPGFPDLGSVSYSGCPA